MNQAKKLAATAAVIIVIAIIALFTRNNWGTIADSAINTIVRTVTGTDMGINIFTTGNGTGGTNNANVDATWQ